MHPGQREPDPPGKHPPFIWRNGVRWFTIPQTAARRHVTPQAVRKWAARKKNLHRVRTHNRHIYVQEDP